MATSAMITELRDAFRTLEVAFPGRRQRSEDVFALYLDALEDIDPQALPHAVRAIVRDSKFFPKAAELRAACRAVMERYVAPTLPQVETPRWNWSANAPCPTCGAEPRLYTIPCPARVCRHPTPHTHWRYDGPDCACWDGPLTGSRRVTNLSYHVEVGPTAEVYAGGAPA